MNNNDLIELRCAVIDDEPLACELIKGYVEATPGLLCEAIYDSASSALPDLIASRVDLVFLDINMPGLNGIELGGIIPESTRIIYITAYERYAVDGFRVNALDYLLKPVSYPEFMRAVSKAFEWKRERIALRKAMTKTDAEPASRPTIMVKSDYRLMQVRLDEIEYVEVKGDKVVFYREFQDPLSTQMSLKEIEDILPPGSFMKVHRSFIVNLDKVKIVERSRIVFRKVYIPISDTHKEEFLRRINVASR